MLPVVILIWIVVIKGIWSYPSCWRRNILPALTHWNSNAQSKGKKCGMILQIQKLLCLTWLCSLSLVYGLFLLLAYGTIGLNFFCIFTGISFFLDCWNRNTSKPSTQLQRTDTTFAVQKLLKVPFSAISLKKSLGNVIIRWPLLRFQHFDTVEITFNES